MSKKFLIAVAAIALLGIVVVIVIPAYVRTHNISSAAPCINRLRQIEAAKEQWALEQNKTTNDVPTWGDLYAYLAGSFTNSYWTNGRLVCPEGGVYTLGRVGELPSCSLGKQDPNHHALPE